MQPPRNSALVEKVRHVRAWEHGGRDEFHSFLDDTLKSESSEARGSGTKALARACLWQDPTAQHGYVVFVGDDENPIDSDDDFDTEGAAGASSGARK